MMDYEKNMIFYNKKSHMLEKSIKKC